MSRDTNLESRVRPLDGRLESRQPYNGLSAAHPENTQPLRRDYEDLRLGQRNGPNDIVVVD